MLDKYDNFFLGHNVNEPVAIEIPIKTQNIYALRDFLESLGFQTTTDGKETDKILIDERIDNHPDIKTYSIITPALQPADRKTFWNVLKQGLQEYELARREQYGTDDTEIFYPHILDLNRLVGYNRGQTQNGPKEKDIADVLSKLQKSPDVINIDRKSSRYQEDLRKVFPYGTLLCGSTIPDAYSVVSGYNTRFLRYATTDVGYGITFSGIFGAKDYSGHENKLPVSKIRFGFVYEYEQTPNSIFFDNAGIELHKTQSNPSTHNETMVNRFDNKTKGTYIVWSFMDNPNDFYLYKIDENSPEFQLLKEYTRPNTEYLSYSKNERFNAWLAEKGKNKTYMPVKDGNLETVQSNIDSRVQQRNAEQQKIELQNQKIKEIEKQLDLLFDELGKMHLSEGPGFTHTVQFSEYFDSEQQIQKYQKTVSEYKQKLEDIEQKLKNIQSEISDTDYLKNHHFEHLDMSWLINRNKETLEIREFYITKFSENLNDLLNKCIERYTEGKINLKNYENLNFDIRKKILLKYMENITKFNDDSSAEKIINLYISVRDEDKQELFDIMYDISKNATSKFRKILKTFAQTGSSQQDKEILTELFSGDNLFVKHTERARKKMQFLMGQIKMKQMAQMNQIANQQTVGSENEG